LVLPASALPAAFAPPAKANINTMLDTIIFFIELGLQNMLVAGARQKVAEFYTTACYSSICH
jgi:hypothetical protein